jgi:hypothetical protein
LKVGRLAKAFQMHIIFSMAASLVGLKTKRRMRGLLKFAASKARGLRDTHAWAEDVSSRCDAKRSLVRVVEPRAMSSGCFTVETHKPFALVD